MKVSINNSQKKLIAVLLPIVGIIILFTLPEHSWDKRPMYLSILIAGLIVLYFETVLFNLENNLVSLGQRFEIGFPVAVLLIASVIVTVPYIDTRNGYWYPSMPRKPVPTEASFTLESAFCKTQKDLKESGPEGRFFRFCTPELLRKNQEATKELAEANAKREEEFEKAMTEWTSTRRWVPPENLLAFKHDLIDSRIAIHWLLLILFLGGVEFHLLSLRSAPNKENAMFGFFKKKPANVLEDFIFAVYGNPPPPKTANLNEAIQIAHDELLMGVVSKEAVKKLATELDASPIPYSTHDLALSVALNFFKQPDLVPQLGDAQLVARMMALDWVSQKTVAPPLVQSFENTLYELYKP